MWVLLWVQLATASYGTLNIIMLEVISNKKVCELAKEEAKVLVTSDKIKSCVY
jgi:hypothetical protein